MEQASVGKVCEWNDLGVDDALGAAGCRFSLHLPASADICLQFEPSSIVHRLSSDLHNVRPRGGHFIFRSTAFACDVIAGRRSQLHPCAACEVGERM